jgi:hypothetical protein
MKPVLAAIAAICAGALGACSGGGGSSEEPVTFNVPKATCGAGDKPETALQGQVPAALRASGFTGFNCNLQLAGQSRGDGANWQTTQFVDKAGRKCAYHGTGMATENRTQRGVRALDITNAASPIHTTSLTTPAMLDPWESLKVNERRQLLAADNGQNGGGGPEVDIYDISGDCRSPQLLASVAVGKADGTTGVVAPVIGHEGSWAPDGLTYYGGDLRNTQYYAVDMTQSTNPKLLTTWKTGVEGATVHGMSVSDDGNRGYFVSLGGLGGTFSATSPANNGLIIADLTDVQQRKANAQIRTVSTLFWKDGSVAQHTILVKIAGKPYIVFVDEAGSAGLTNPTTAQQACDAGLPPFPMARIIDISNETAPKVVSKLALETHDPANCSKVIPDIAGLNIFTYGSHYCSVDNRQNATTLACGYFNSGIRIFDIRNPERPREIAYYNPAGTTTPSPGSNHVQFGQWKAGGPDWCSAQVHLDAASGTVWSTCQDNGVLVLRFTNGVWPFPGTTTPPGQQN